VKVEKEPGGDGVDTAPGSQFPQLQGLSHLVALLP
jgi:hypothetical protein